MRKLLKIVAVLALLLVIGVIGLALGMNSALKRGIERGGTYALGVETTLDSASLRPLAGKCSIGGLTVANPSGYKAERFLGLGEGQVEVSLGSLSGDVITLPLLALDGVEINLEKNEDKANYDVIVENLKKFESGDQTEPDDDSAGKKYIVDELRITNVRATVDLLGAQGLSSITIPIDEVLLENVGSAGEPVSTSELISIVVTAVLAAVAQNDQLPGEIASSLTSRMEGLEFGDVDEALQKAGFDNAGDAINKAASELGNLLGGSKEKKPE